MTTPEKWARFEYLLDIHTKMVKGILGRADWAAREYHYFDFYAGPGVYDVSESSELAGEIGSPVRAVRILKDEGMPFHFWAFDHDEAIAARLSRVLEHDLRLGVRCGVLACDEAVDYLLARAWPKQPYGLAFLDPNGLPDWRAVRRFARSRVFSRIDLLLNVNSANCKWCFTSRLHPETRRPTEHLKDFGKKHIYLWTPHPDDRHQFALAYCTNGPFPVLRDWGFHLLGTPEGNRIGRLMDYSERERREMGGTTGFLFGD